MNAIDEKLPLIIFTGKEPAVRLLLQAYLKSRNCRFESADNEEELEHLCSVKKPVLIVFDISYELEKDLEQLRRLCALKFVGSIPIIALIGHGRFDTLQSLLDCGVSAYFAKPLDLKALDKFVSKNVANNNFP